MKDLADLLEFEIQRALAEGKAPGWTQWALLGATATLIGLASVEAEKSDLSLAALAPPLVFLCLVSDYLLTLMVPAIRPPGARDGEPRFIHAKTFFDINGGASVLALLVRSFVLGILIVSHVTPHSHSSWIPVYLYLALPPLALLLFGLFRVLELFVRADPPWTPSRKAIRRALYVSLHALHFLAVLAAASHAAHATAAACGWSCWRVAALLSGASLLAVIACRRPYSAPLLPALIDLRRKIGLAQVDRPNALAQARAVLEGLRLGDVLQEYMGRFLARLKEHEGHLLQAHRLLVRGPEPGRRKELDKCVAECKKRARKAWRRAVWTWTLLDREIQEPRRLPSHALSELRSVLQTLRDEMDASNLATKRIEERIAEEEERLEHGGSLSPNTPAGDSMTKDREGA